MRTLKTLICLSRHVKSITISTIRLNHTDLKSELARKIPSERSRITEIRRRQAKEDIVEPKHGMLGLNDLIWETSEQNDEHELVFRGYSIPQILNDLPKLPGTTIPPAEGHFWLLLTGKIPTLENVKALMKDWDSRAIVPFFVEKLIRDMPPTTPPVEQLSSALNILQSKFVESYTTSGVFKEKYWEMVLEDCMDLIAKVPTIAALIYNKLYRHKMFLPMRNPHTDWASNFAIQLGVNNKIFEDLMRLFMIVYSDLHGKNFSGAACLSGSALSDPYKSYANGLNQLASYKSGFYAHDHIEFLKKIHDEVGMNPTKPLILEYLQCKDYKDKDIPGYASLNFKKADPRYICMLNFAKQHFGDDPLLNLAVLVTESISEFNSSLPNVDAISGLLFYLFGIREENFLPVLFGISRSLGLLSSYVWDRALGVPLEKKTESSDTKPSTKMPEKGTCADFIKSHGITKIKLMQGTDIYPIITSSATNLNVPLRPSSNPQSVKSAHQKNSIDLSTTLPTQESLLSPSLTSQMITPNTTSGILPTAQAQRSAPAILPPTQSQQNSNAIIPVLPSQLNPTKMIPVSSSQNSSNALKLPVSQPQLGATLSVLQSQSQLNFSVAPSSQTQTTSNAKFLASKSQFNETESIVSPSLNSSGIVPISQTQVNLSSMAQMTPISQSQINSSTQTSTFQSSSTNFHSPVTSQSHSPDEYVAKENSVQKQSNDTLTKENTEKLNEKKKPRHIMLSKPLPLSVATSESYSNKNWNINSLKSSKKLNKTSEKTSGYQNAQLFNKMHKKNDKTKITSFIKEKQPSTTVKKSNNIDFWKCNY